MEDRLGRSGATWGFLALTAFITALPTVSAVRSVLTAAGVLDVDVPVVGTEVAGFGLIDDESSVRVAEGFSAVVSIPIALACLIVLSGLLTWREWAREGALGLFGILGSVLLVFSLGGATNDPPGENALLGVAASLLILGIATLAVSRPVRTDFELRRLAEARRYREAATAERRQREAVEAERRAQHLAARRRSEPTT